MTYFLPLILFITLLIISFFLFFFLLSKFFLPFLIKSQPLTKAEYPELYAELSFLSRCTGLTVPQLFFLEEEAPNAFALRYSKGRKSSFFITKGLFSLLSIEEMRMLFSLCFAQVKLKSFLFSPMLAFLVFPFAKLTAILPPLFSFPLQYFLSFFISCFTRPSRLFLADSFAKEITQNPDLLAKTIRKIASLGRRVPLHSSNIALDHLFLFPVKREKEHAFLLDTHPRVEERIEELLRLFPLA